MEPAGQRSDRSPRRTDKAAEADSERHRTRERLEATLAGLGELDYLRQRQEALVRAVLGSAEPTPRAESGRSLEEKLLEDNISLLKRQLNCLRKRDAGLLSQLHELDKQINDLRLDTEKPTEEPHDPDSRPSSGFYELSDGTSGSLSNSSNSVFSECLSSCQSSTCLGGGGGPLDASLNLTDGPPKLTDDFLEWLDCRDGQSELTGTIRRSFCIDHSSSAEAVNDVNPKYQCDLVSKNGSDIYRYPSPLHAVAVQSPMFILSVMGNLKEAQETDCNAAAGCIVPEPTVIKPEGPLLPAGRACPASLPTTRKLDGYILSIIQKKSQPVRTNKPRTSVNADPVKGILRHGSLCIKQPGAATAHSAASNPKNSKQSCLHSSAITSPENGTGLPPKQGSKESPDQQLETKRLPPTPGSSPGNPDEGQNTLRLTVMLTGQGFGKNPPAVTSTALKDINTPTSAPHSSCDGTLKESVPLPKEMNISATKRVSPKTTGSSCHSSSFDERPSLDFKSEGSSSQSLDEGLLVNAHYIPAQQPAVRLHRVTKNVKIVKSSTLKHRVHVQHAAENCSPTLKEKGKVTGKKCRFPEDLDPNKRIKRISQRARKPLHSSGDSVGVKNPGTARPGSRGHGHAKDVVVAKPKHKRGDYRRWKSSAEISYEEALRRARRKSQREVVGVFAQVPLPYASPYAYIASDSEYSAECESLFHSTVVDTSEDEQSNYTTNCFGDSESSLSEVEFVGESTTSTSDTDESGGLIWSQFVHTLPAPAAAELHATAKAFVKIKASHNLKKKILRFRSGSLKLMTTV